MKQTSIRDLATLYVGLAQGVDGQFHFRELETVSALLRRYMASDSEISAMIDGVISDLASDEVRWEKQVLEAIHRLGQHLSDEEKRDILAELSQIGLADRKFLHSEAAFIQLVKDSWEVSFLSGQEEAWSILGEGGIQGEALQALAVLFLCIAHAPDAEISRGEREAMLNRLSQWIPDASPQEVEHALREAMTLFVTRSVDENVAASAATVKRLVPLHQLEVIYEDIRHISLSNKILQVEERTWLQTISEALGIGS